jgi:tRNA A-37 threonylcarbamoyl transferase component Bud32
MSRSPVAFGSYVITRRIARGGMAEIYRAQRRGAVGKAWVALKMMRPSLEHEELREQLFQREARIAALIHHPHVVELLEFGEEQGHKFLAMEYVRGRDLSHLIHPRGEGTGEALAPELGLTIVLHAAAGLGHAHRLVDPSTGAHLAIVHRDISPGNVMVGYDGTVKVLDFGVARINETHGMRTQTGTLRGKFAYMSPEQTLGSGVDARSDVFSLGTVLYELLTGSNPFRARNAMTTIERVQRVRPVPPSRSNRAIPREVDELLARCLAKDPKRRFADATELCEALDRLLGARGRASEADIAGLMRGRFAWEQGEEEKELAEEAESAALIEVVDFAVGGEDRGLDAPNVAVSQEDVAEPAALGAAAREPVEAAAEEDVYGVFDSAEDERTVAQPSPVMARGPRPATPERPRAPSRTARGASSAAVADVVPVVDLGGASDDATAVGRAALLVPGVEIVMGEVGSEPGRRRFEVVRGEVARGPIARPSGELDEATAAPLATAHTEETDALLRALRDQSPPASPASPRRWGAGALLAVGAAVLAVALGAVGWWMAQGRRPEVVSAPKKIAPVSIAVSAAPAVSLTAAAPPLVGPPAESPLPAGELEEEEDPPRAEDDEASPAPSPPRERPREPRRRAATKRPAPTGFLNVGAKPWGEIEIDGKKWPYQTPQAGIELPVGKHVVRLTNRETGVSKTAVVHIRAGGYRTVSLDLRTPN